MVIVAINSIPLKDIEKAELLLQEFCLKFSALYGTYVVITRLFNTLVSSNSS